MLGKKPYRASNKTCAVLCIVASATATAQQRVQFESYSDAIRIEVWATDSSGRHVNGLTAEDLILRIDDKEWPILDLQPVRRAHQGGASGTEIAKPVSSAQAETTVGGAQYLILLDFVTRGMNILEASRAVHAARSFIGQLAPQDRASIILFSPGTGFDVLIDFTRDHPRLLAALDRLDQTEFGIRYHKQSRGGMLFSLLRLAPIIGTQHRRTDVLFFTLGDPDNILTQPLYAEMLGTLAASLRKAGVVVHALNPAALPAADAIGPSRPRPTDSGARSRPQRDSRRDHDLNRMMATMAPRFDSALANRGPARRIADLTGGLAAFYHHTFPDAMTALVSSANSAYELVFTAPPEKRGSIDIHVDVRERGRKAICWPCQVEIVAK